ncbi:MAG: FimV/HubP family polar landmark protein, partial [Pseudomonadales bacterium]
MKNWLRLLCSLLVLGLAQGVYGLGLGGISAESALNEPLEARIELLNVGSLSEQEIIVEIGSVSDYEMAGVSRDYFHTSIEFEPHLAGSNGQSYIRLTTTAPVREPYLNFVIQIRWPQGRLLREYTLLLDLPVFSGRTEASQINQPTANRPQPSASNPAPRSEPQANTRTATQQSSQQTFGGAIVSGSQYRVATGETLWSLAGRVASGQQMSRHQAMLAIRDLNAEAFVNGDPNTLQAGYLIRIPTEEQANARSASQAYSEFAAIQQGGDVGSSATPISAAATDFRDQPTGSASSGGRLALSSSSALGSGSETAEDSAEILESLASENETLKEELDRAELENEDLRERVSLLEERLSVSESLIEIESDEIANVQEGLSQAQQQDQPQAQEEVQPSDAEMAVAEPAPAPSPATPAAPPEPGLLSKIMSFAPFLGALIVVALLVGMFLMKRRKSEADDDFLHDELDEDESSGDAPEEEFGESGHQQTTAFDNTASMRAEEDSAETDDSFESMDELFGTRDDADEFDEAEQVSDQESEPEAAESETTDSEDEDGVEDIDLEAALEDLDDFADMDSFDSEDIEDFDLESAEAFDGTDDKPAEQNDPDTSDDDDFSEMDFDSVELPEVDEDDDNSPDEEDNADDANSMDFDLDDFEPSAEEDESDEEPSGNEMDFDSADIELPEVEDEDD